MKTQTITIQGTRYEVVRDLTHEVAYRTPNGGMAVRSEAQHTLGGSGSPARSNKRAHTDSYREVNEVDGRQIALIGTIGWDAAEWDDLQVLEVRQCGRR